MRLFIEDVDTLDWVGKEYKQGMNRYSADVTFKRGGITYFIEFLDPFGSNVLAKWWDNSDNGCGYNNQGDVFVSNPFNAMTGSFSPENIDKYIRVDSDYERKPSMSIQRIIIDKVKRQLDYDALNDVKRTNESIKKKSIRESSGLDLKKTSAGHYKTADGKYEVEKSDGFWYAVDTKTGQSVVDCENSLSAIKDSLESYIKSQGKKESVRRKRVTEGKRIISKDEYDYWFNVGLEAFKRGDKCVPAHSKELRDYMKENPSMINSNDAQFKKTDKITKAWIDGWTKGNMSMPVESLSRRSIKEGDASKKTNYAVMVYDMNTAHYSLFTGTKARCEQLLNDLEAFESFANDCEDEEEYFAEEEYIMDLLSGYNCIPEIYQGLIDNNSNYRVGEMGDWGSYIVHIINEDNPISLYL